MLAAAPVARNEQYSLMEDVAFVADDAVSSWVASLTLAQPLHWYRFDEASGTKVRDEGSAHRDATYGGGVTLGRPGVVSAAAHFDGTGFAMIGAPQLGGEWTVEAIASIELGSPIHSLLGGSAFELNNTLATSLQLGEWPNGTAIGYTAYKVANWDSGIPAPTELTHVAWVGTSTGVDIYVSGMLALHIDAAIPLSRTAIASGWIDEELLVAHDAMTGLIDELAIYDRALSATDIADHAYAMTASSGGNIPVDIGVLKNDTDADGDRLTAIIETTTSHGTLRLRAAGGFFYEPQEDFSGTDQFTYRVTDGALQSNIATVTLQVVSVNDRPVAVQDRGYTVARGATLTIDAAHGVITNDHDVDNLSLTAILASPPLNGTVTLQSNGSFTYTPRANWIGADRFTYRASDGQTESDAVAVIIRTVRPAIEEAGAADDYFTVAEDSVLDVNQQASAAVLRVPLLIRSFVYDGVRDRFWVVMLPNTGPRAGTLTEVNPYTGELGASIPLPRDPGLIAVSDDGETAYITAEDHSRILWIDLITGKWGPSLKFEGQIRVRELHAIPGQPGAVLATTWNNSISQPAGTYIYDNGIARPFGLGGSTFTVDNTGTHAYGYDNWISSNYFYQYDIIPEGARVIKEHPWGSLLSGAVEGFQAADGRLFVSGARGAIIDLSTATFVAPFEGGFAYRPVVDENRLYSFDDRTQTFFAYDLETYQLRSSATIPSVGPVSRVLYRFGDDGFALYGNNEIVFARVDSMFGISRPGVLRNDRLEGTAIPTVQLVTNVAHGELELHSDGTFRYAPVGDYNGPDEFTYAFLDTKGIQRRATVHLTVTPTNDAPIARDDVYLLPNKTKLVVTAAQGVLANDYDIDTGDSLRTVLKTFPRFGTFDILADGSFIYEPKASFTLSDSFTYVTTDEHDFSELRTVTIRLNVPTIEVGSHQLLANTPNQKIDIRVTGGQLVSGLDLFAQVGDGGPERTSIGLPAGVDGPSITNVLLKQNTIFASLPDQPTDLGSLPQLANWSLSASAGGSVVADGLLVTLIVDTTSFFEGTWDLRLANALPDHPLGPLNSQFANSLAYVTNGTMVITPAQITERRLFYNHSAWDGDNPAASADDDNAVAIDKGPLLPGATATLANYSNYSRGINGVMFDMVGLPAATILGPSDFVVRSGRLTDRSLWTTAPTPSISVRRGAGKGNADRVTLIWPDDSLVNTWLEVTVKSGARTLLGHDDVFYFGNAMGEVGNDPANTFVTSIDVIAIRDHQRGPFERADIDDPYDINRDRLVTSIDTILARDHQSGALTSLPLISIPFGPRSAVAVSQLTNVDAIFQDRALIHSLFRQATICVGDVNNDGMMDSSDLIAVFQRGHYESKSTQRLTWEDGDWDGDGDFDANDLILAGMAGRLPH